MVKMPRSEAFRTSAVCVALLLVGATLGCRHDPNVQKQKYLESGKRYAADGKYKEAAIQFSNALKVDHNFAEAHYQLGTTYLKMGSGMSAYAELSRTVALQPNNIQARIDLGNLLLAGKQPDRAAEQANAVLALKSDNPDAFALLSSIAASKGDRPEALTQIQKALSIDPNRAAFHTSLGLIQSSDPGNSASAEDQLRKSVNLDPANVTSRLVLSALLQRKGDIGGALEQQKAAVAADPKNVMARASLAELYVRQGDKPKAEEVLHQAAEDLSDAPAAATLLETYLRQTNQFDRAEGIYADLVAKHPKSTPLKLAYARVLLARRDYAKARTVANDLVKSDGSDPEVVALNSTFLLNDGKSSEAFDALQKASKNTPDSALLKIWLGRAAIVKGDMNVAQQSFTDAARIDPRNMEAQNGLAQVAMQRHDATLLAQAAETALKANPQAEAAYLWRGIAEAGQGQTEKAETDFRQALKLDPKNWAASLELGQMKLSQKHIPEGKALLEQALADNPSSTRALALLVSLDLTDKQPQRAISRIQAQIAKVPQNGEMYVQLSTVQMASGDANGALDSAQKAMQISPADGTAVMAYTRAQLAHGDSAKAIDTWQQWLKTHPNDAQANVILGTLEQARGDNEKAMDYYKTSLKIQPEQPIASNNLAYLMVEGGQNLDVALSLAQTARRLMPNSPSAADTLAWVYFHKGTYASARDLLEEAVKTAPDDASIQYHLGLSYSKLSSNADAALHLKKAIALAPDSQTAKDAQKALQQLG